MENYLLSAGGEDVVVQTSDGGVSVSTSCIEQLVVQRLNDDGTVAEEEELDSDGFSPLRSVDIAAENKKADEIASSLAASSMASAIQRLKEALDKPIVVNVSVETGPVASEEEPVKEEKVFNEEETTTEETKVSSADKTVKENFVGFREKFLGLKAEGATWENSIIDKMAQRVERLKTFASAIDDENNALEDFKSKELLSQ